MVKIRYSINMLKYGWSKWEGGNKGLVKEELDEWYCQNCGEIQRKGLPSYMAESAIREFLRVCASCKHEMVVKNLKTYWQLMGATREV